MQKKEIHSSTLYVQEWLTVFNIKTHRGSEFPRSNNADIDWNMRMPRDARLIHPKVEILPK